MKNIYTISGKTSTNINEKNEVVSADPNLSQHSVIHHKLILVLKMKAK